MIVVTGAAGHVGANLVRELLERGSRVRAVVRREATSLKGLGIEQVRGDVLAPETLRAAFEGAEIIYHLAARISIVGDPDGLVARTNVTGAENVARAALRSGVRRLVHVSSIHAFEQHPLRRPLDETRNRCVAARHYAYDRSKAAGEAAVRAVVKEGLDAVIVNPTGVIGPYDFAPSRMGQVFLDLAHRRLPALVDGGFNWVDAGDVALGAMAACERGRTGESYILGGHWASVRHLAQLAEDVTAVRAPRWTTPMSLARVAAPFAELYSRLTSTEPLFTREALGALRGNRSVRIDKAQRELGYAPRPLRSSVERVYESFDRLGRLRFRREGMRSAAFRGAR
jgi:dihydroflavonol-4-reductase